MLFKEFNKVTFGISHMNLNDVKKTVGSFDYISVSKLNVGEQFENQYRIIKRVK